MTSTKTKKRPKKGILHVAAYLALGMYFGIVLTQSEVLSWFRIQEMFRFQSFHMYGIIGSAVVVAAGSIAVFRRFNLKSMEGERVTINDKKTGPWNTRYWAGGFIFGIGWALTGACPGPIFALIGNGVSVMLVALVGAIAGTWAYGAMRSKLPHY